MTPTNPHRTRLPAILLLAVLPWTVVLVGLTQVTVAWGFLRLGNYVVVPLGSLLAWTIAWWFYWPALRAIARFERFPD